MSKTAVGLFENPGLADQVVHDLEAGGFPRNEIRILGESLDMAGSGVTSTPNIDFEVSLNRDLRKIGATDSRGGGLRSRSAAWRGPCLRKRAG